MNDIVEMAPARIRLVATDLDGTLLRDDRTVSARTQRTLARIIEAGVTLALVTARPPRFVRQLARELGLGGVAICCNGAIIYDIANESVLQHTPIPAAVATMLALELREAFPGMTFAVESELTFGCEPAYAALGALTQQQAGLLADAEALCSQPTTKLIARHPQRGAEELHPEAQRIAGKRAAVTYSSPRYLELSAWGVDKAATLAQLCERLSVTPNEVVAFGDMPNDAPMLRWAGRGIAVANAHDEARTAADDITASNMDDGVALALERLLNL